LKADIQVIKIDPLACDDVRSNPPERCYFCKKENFAIVLKFAKKLGYDAVAEGSNADDAGDYRPGMKAVAELGLLSHCSRPTFARKKSAEIARAVHLPNAEKPSSPCLATRVAYGSSSRGI